MTLYHWSPLAIHKKTIVFVSQDNLQIIKGITPLGTFFLSDDLDISTMLSESLTTTPSNPDPTPQLLTDLIARIPTPDSGSFIQFFSFPVFSNIPTDILGDNLLPIWKWAKPESVYRKTGFWEPELGHALEDGEWNGGKGLTLLSRLVSEEVMQRVRAGHIKYMDFDRLSD